MGAPVSLGGVMHMRLMNIFFMATLISTGSVPAFADRVEGVWKSNPDRNGLVVHVRTRPCGTAVCGMVERAKDSRGYDKRSDAVGKRLFWDLVEQPDGSYEGKYWEPRRNLTLDTRVRVDGDALRLEACDDSGCRDMTMTRLK
jgi:uncharacterized protein (DUF2147 family)